MEVFWWTTDTTNCIREYHNVITKDIVEQGKAHGWEALEPKVIPNSTPGSKKQIILDNLHQLDSKDIVVIDEGVLTKKRDRVELLATDGSLCMLVHSSMVGALDHWLWSYMIKKHGHISLNHGIQEWCEGVDHPEYTFYHEIIPPNGEAGIRFSDELEIINLDDNYVKEFIDQVHYTCPHMKRMRPDYNKWPTIPITFDDRYRDSYGFYFMYFTEWIITASEWENMQLAYLDDFLTKTPQYTGNKKEMLDYAKSKWRIDYYSERT
jgi:hypothetical protein